MEIDDLDFDDMWLSPDRPEVVQACAALEERFVDRGLQFTRRFSGAVPVQAYGYIDGLRFYFRLRHNTASLRCGPYDLGIEVVTYRNTHDSYLTKLTRLVDAGEIKENDEARVALTRNALNRLRMQSPDSTDFYPYRITLRSEIDDVIPGDVYLGWLEPDALAELFVRLVESLSPVPESEQVSEHTQQLLSKYASTEQ